MATENQNSDRPVLYFDDLRVGQRVVSGTYLLDEAQIIAFASQYDPQPFHTDPEGATNSLFGELVASGWHTAAITMRLMVDSGLPIAGGHIGVGVEIAWPRPTRPGSVLRVESEIIDLTPSRSRRTAGWPPSETRRSTTAERLCRS
ncbi:MAG: MaoC family dehydratase [Planctomycetaceae bacterium]